MNELKEIAADINKRDAFLLVGHALPDGDCIGALIALYLGMVAMGKEVRMLLQDSVPAMYEYLPGAEAVLLPAQFTGPVHNVIYLDCSDEERPGDQMVDILKDRSHTINIDHHQSNNFFGDLNFVDERASSTAELVYELLQLLPVEINADIANALYVGIVQDTGGFQHNNTSSQTFRTAAALLEQGVDLDQVKLNLYESKSREEVALLGLALQSLQLNSQGRVAWMTLHYDDILELGALQTCPEGMINNTLTIQGVEVGLLFRELTPGLIKISFRSKGTTDVDALAARFGGGGHPRAAGAQQSGSMAEVVSKVIAAVESVIG